MTQVEKGAANVRIMIVDDHPLIRHGLAELISHEPGIEVCATAENVSSAWEKIEEHEPPLVIVDLALRDGDGLELIKNLKATHPHIRILALSMHDEKLYAERALRAGASGYVEKQEPPEVVLHAIREVVAGRVYLSKAMSDRFLHQMVRHGGGSNRTPLETLSDRELEVLDLLGSGLNTAEIATRLHLSKKTIQSHRERLKAKLRLKGAAELVGYAVARHFDKA